MAVRRRFEDALLDGSLRRLCRELTAMRPRRRRHASRSCVVTTMASSPSGRFANRSIGSRCSSTLQRAHRRVQTMTPPPPGRYGAGRRALDTDALNADDSAHPYAAVGIWGSAPQYDVRCHNEEGASPSSTVHSGPAVRGSAPQYDSTTRDAPRGIM